jgi:hypothetical protein
MGVDVVGGTPVGWKSMLAVSFPLFSSSFLFLYPFASLLIDNKGMHTFQ